MISEPATMYEVRPFAFDELEDVRQLYVRSFGVDPGMDYFQWKYAENPAGQAFGFVATHESKLAAFYGVIPEFYWINGMKQVIYQSMDTMTDPEHRGKGLFLKLARATFDGLRARDGTMHLIGYPGPTSYPGFVKRLEWKSLAEFKYIFAYRAVFKAIALIGDRDRIKIEHVETFGPEWEVYFNEQERSTSRIAKYLDREVLAWRSLDHPSMEYKHVVGVKDGKMVGFCVYRIDEEGRAFILYMDTRVRKDVADYVPSVLRYLYDGENVKSVYTFVSGEKDLEMVYKRSGFIQNPFSKGPFSYRTPFIVLADEVAEKNGAYDLSAYMIQPLMRDY